MFYEKLLAETEAARSRFLGIETIQRGMQGKVSLDAYLGFLSQAYHHVRHTVPLLMACGSRLPMEKEWLREAIAEYIEEETGHQEWILNDIGACGADKEAVRNSSPHASTELMVAYAWDSVSRGNPVSFFGMVLVLEGTSVALATLAAQKIQQALGLPEAAFSYLTSHGSLDVDHMKFFEKLMDRVDDEDDQQAIIHMANMMYDLYGNVFRSLPLD
ncbi:TenA family transcriptional regulator [Thiolapillus brandeum]|uniref:TenA family transcriptional activator n=1 Tax=Thiolapillus brandeum TaxID=1076588 RepID=A0A7U6JJZ7_9GAMM|nr:iron-containing redox enzyme family protein [Thiolapillus brandeum]BAO45205.1 TenA family transcriptional activator [Thiolapillus brandeum]